MSFFSSLFNRKSSAPIARDRLQILLAHERVSVAADGQPDLLVQLHREIMEVISRHLQVDQDKVQVKLDRGANCSMLEIDIEVPGIDSIANKPDAKAEAKAAPEA